MLNHQTIYINTDTCKGGVICDDAGGSTLSSRYSHNFEGYVVIVADSNTDITISGEIYTHNIQADYLTIWDGDTSQGHKLIEQAGGTCRISVTATSGRMTIRFVTDASGNLQGFALAWVAVHANRCQYQWNMVDGDTVHVRVGPNSPALIYDDSGPFGYYENNVDCWMVIETDPGDSLVLCGGYYFQPQTFMDIYDGSPQGTLLYQREAPTQSTMRSVNVTATSGRIVLHFYQFASSSLDNRWFGYDFAVTNTKDRLHPYSNQIGRFRVANTTTTSATLYWDNTTDTMLFSYSAGNVRACGGSVTLDNLLPNTVYNVHIVPASSTDVQNDSWCVSICTDMEFSHGTISHDNFPSPYVRAYHGDFFNPYENIGIVSNRHQIHYSNTQTYPYRDIPEGATSSVQLGCVNNHGGYAEALVYALEVDTLISDLLLFKYAARLQNPNHLPEAQPRLRIELLNERFEVIDSLCGREDFIANGALGWNVTVAYLWKGWTDVGIDLTPLHGQKIFLRITVNDCAEGGHYGLAHFTLDFTYKNMRTDACGVVLNNSFTVPSGFGYRWYTDADTTTISTSRSINFTSDNATYYCDCSFLDKPSCTFTMSAFAGVRYPLALFDTAVTSAGCHTGVQFINQSTITSDGITPVGTHEGVESAYWDFGNGQTSTQYHPYTTYTDTGTYTVTLVASIANGSCTDTVQRTISIASPNVQPYIDGPQHRCFGAPPDTLILHAGTTSSAGWVNDTMLVSVNHDTTYIVTVTDTCGYLHTLSHCIIVHPIYHDTIYDTIREGEAYTFNGISLTDSGTYHANHITTAYACDSITTLHLNVISDPHLPDNIDSAACTIIPDGNNWDIRVGWSSSAIVSNFNIPLAGDLDNDGNPEIVCFSLAGESVIVRRVNSQILVYDGVTKLLKKTINIASPISSYEAAGYGLIKTSTGKGLIVVACYDRKLRAYDITASNPNTPYWVSNSNYGSTDDDYACNLSFADFNHDGHPEVYVRNKIYNAENGKLLATATGGVNTGSSYAHHSYITHRKLSSPFAADVLGDENLELILGNEIYTVSITNLNGTSGNSATRTRRVTPPESIMEDGHTQVADFNNDGHLDIFISLRNSESQTPGRVYGYVWDVYNNTVSNLLNINTSFTGKSIPLIADIDNDGMLEVVIQCGVNNSTNKYRAYKYNPTTMSFSLLWGFAADEDSFSNGVTAFDFNQDGLLELMICDQSMVRIVNGSGKSHITGNDTLAVYVMNSFPFSEITIMQYPIIADVDNDGHAEIVSVGSNKLNIFESTTNSWAPARRVWNQYMYNVTNINEDLTIPQYQFNNATPFTDPQGMVRYPYNHFLQQVTTIDYYGRPYVAVTDVVMNSGSASISGDTVSLTINYSNQGDIDLRAPYVISVYRNEYRGQLLWSDTLGTPLSVDSTVSHVVRIPRGVICGLADTDSLIVALNDVGTGIAQHGGQQAECDTTNNTISVQAPWRNTLLDTTSVVCDSLVWRDSVYRTSTTDVRHFPNPVGCDSILTLSLTVNHSVIIDTLAIVIDTLRWEDSIYHASTSDTLHFNTTQGCDSLRILHLVVTGNPDNVDSSDCTTLSDGLLWSIGQPIISNVTGVQWQHTPVVGDIDDDGQTEIIVTGADGNGQSCVQIYNADGTLKKQFQSAGFYSYYCGLAIAKVQWQEGIYQNIIVLYSSDKHLYAYSATGQQLWRSDQTFVGLSSDASPIPSPSFADFNHDGWTEIYIGNEIYDAATGRLLCRGASNNGRAIRTSSQRVPYHTMAADLYGGPDLELAAGNAIYSVNIHSRTDMSANSMTVVRRIPSANRVMHDGTAIPTGDGNTFLVDINLDGHLDVLVMACQPSTRMLFLYVWDVESGTIICSRRRSHITYFGVPQIGDINNDGWPEICFISGSDEGAAYNTMYAFRYNPSRTDRMMPLLWSASHADNSSATGLTLFDFNHDGSPELVYRDENSLRIINGSLRHHQTGLAVSQPYDLTTYPCWSSTAIEYPVVADVDQDGEAEIVVTGAASTTSPTHLYIFNSGSFPWAPARRVWNQYMYNITNINEDLTVPQYQFNNATAFTDPQGVVRRPYNNFLQQATTIDRYGRPFIAVPDVVMDSASVAYANDSVTLTLHYCNHGDNTLNAPYSCSVYNPNQSTPLHTITVTSPLPVDSCASQQVCFANSTLCAVPNLDSLLVFVNRNGHRECDTTNNSATVAIHPTYRDTLSVSICDNEDYSFYGTTYFIQGYHNHLQQSTSSCDSLHVLDLSVRATTVGDTIASVCDSFTWYGTTYTTSTNTPTHLTTNAANCDSTTTLHLTVRYSTVGDTTANVCNQFTWYGTTYSASTDTPTYLSINAANCDSTTTLHLTVRYSSTGDTIANVCDQFTWYGTTYTATTDTPTHVSTNAVNCDSTTTLHLTVRYSTTGDTIASECDSFSWCGTTYTTSTDTPTHITANAANCDSTTTLYLTIRYSTTGDTTASECDSFSWYGTTYTTSTNTPTHLTTNAANCDSTTTLHLTIRYSSTGDTIANVCDQFTWYGTAYTASTDTPTNLSTNAANCDSTTTLHLTVRHSTFGDTTANVCDQFTWYGTTYTASTDTPTHVSTNAVNCDSTTTLHLTVRYSSTGDTSANVCDQFTWYGTTYTTTTDTPTHLTTNAANCDSTTTLHLTVRYSSTGDTTANVCDQFTWYGNTYTATTDTPTHISTNTANCDSTTTLHLTIRHSTTGDTIANVCDQFTWYGNTYTASTSTPTHMTTNAADCDSTTTLHLTIRYSSTGDTAANVCDSFTWYGNTYTASTDTPTHLSTNAANCDSTTTLHLIVRYSTTGDTIASVCDQFTWYGTTYTSSTDTPTHLSTNAANCDSTTNLHLTIRYSTMGDTIASECDSFSWHGTTYTATTNTPTHLTTNAANCDSTTILHLTIRYSTTGDTTANVCDQFTWYGTTHTASTNTPTHISTNAADCDSTTTLHLTVRYSSTGDTTASECDSFTWYGTTYTTSTDTPTHLSTNAANCDSTTTLHLIVRYSTTGDTIASVCDQFTWYGTTYTSSTDTPTHLSTNAANCDSTINLHLTVRHSTTGDTIANVCDQFTWYGNTYTASTNSPTHLTTNTANCDSTTILHLTVRYSSVGDTTASECDQFVWYGTTYTASTDTPTHTSTNHASCDSTTTLHLTIRHSSDSTYYDTCTENQLPRTFNDQSFTSDTHAASIIINAAGCDSIIHYNLHVWHNVSTQVDSTVCDDRLPLSWSGHNFTQGGTQHRVLATSHGADSTVHSTLHVNPTYNDTIHASICDNQSFPFGDSAYTVTGFHTDTLQTMHGCDSISTLHLTLRDTYEQHYTDTICHGMTYEWHGQTVRGTDGNLTEEFLLRDTLTSVYGCDSVDILSLTKMAQIHISFSADTDCAIPGYRLSALATAPLSAGTLPDAVPYIYWSSYPIDNRLVGQEHLDSVAVSPNTATEYLLYADYHETPLCPVTDTITLNPIIAPVAEIKVNPTVLTQDNLHFVAIDRSRSYHTSRAWYVDGLRQDQIGTVLEGDADIHADSLRVELEIYNGQCHDTAEQTLLIYRVEVFAPNVFTPLREDNNIFRISTLGVLDGELFIYDRIGDLVFYTTDMTQGWDGTYHGETCTQRAYVWIFRYHAIDSPTALQEKTGTVTLLR